MRVLFSDWFADYEILMINAIKDTFEIDSIILTKGFKSKLILLFSSKIIFQFLVKLYFKRKFKKNDIIIFNESRYHKYADIIKLIECRKILLLRNIVSYNKKFNIDDAKYIFDKIYSFDEKDCNKYNLNILNQIFPFRIDQANDFLKTNNREEKFDVYYLGKEKERGEKINNTYDSLKKLGLSLNFLVFAEHGKENKRYNYIRESISYIDNLVNVINSKAILEINIEDQSGLTLRTLEAIFFNKKLITNNTDIINYDFYSPDRFFILGINDLNYINGFLEKKTEEVNQKILIKYSPEFIFKNVIIC
ncbi:hypothetical protein B4923_10440 [Brenneria roseae subsp. americana]|uniref:Lipopolysaccharide biosynthesis protein n=1 Tax=Brenneria roseae subsp. americana TaxID=1508507 RepID=A0A2U1TS66_9GAMM|nr:hypothetical protein [Brenneria roseae]PWC12260.1 hypothetical protein B4923_10440 [Brenneria roseae subsp. americana]